MLQDELEELIESGEPKTFYSGIVVTR